MLKIMGGLMMVVSFFVVLGAAGSDCDGDCVQNAMSIKEILFYVSSALACGFLGFKIYMYGSDYNV
tara:strand:+ start:332 stop:529 length:198 start_codon:yes stop_codon:yes gene_type:complete